MDNKTNLKILSRGKNREKVKFLGFNQQPLSIVKSCDVFILPSLYAESITKSVIEAMLLEKAIIMTDLVGNEELCVNGKSGIKIPTRNSKAIKDEILKLYNNRQLVTELGIEAKKHILTHLNHSETIKKYDVLFRDLIKN